MRAIVVKELRENALWAALMLIALAGLTAYALHEDLAFGLVMIGRSFQTVTLGGFACAGLVLGLLQTLQDARRGRSEFVLHRPLARSRIFIAKVISGALLYAVVTLVPLLAALAWVALPAPATAPFEIHMALPAVSDVFGGLMWYLAGLLIGSRKARWIGSRLFPAGVAVVSSAASGLFATGLGEALIPITIGAVILLAAARGSFIAGGSYEPLRPIERALHTASVMAGALLLVPLATVLVADTLRTVLRSDGETSTQYAYYEMDPSGEMRIVHRRGSAVEQVTDLAGNPVEDRDRQAGPADRRMTLVSLPFGSDEPTGKAWLAARARLGFRRADTHVWHFAGESEYDCFYIVRRRTIEIYKRGPYSRRFLGSLGPDGFRGPEEAPVPFERPLANVTTNDSWLTLVAGSTAYDVAMSTQRMKPLFTVPSGDPIVEVGYLNESNLVGRIALVNRRTVALTRSSVYVVNLAGEARRAPLEDARSRRGAGALLVGQTTDGDVALWYATFDAAARGRAGDYAVIFDQDGNARRRFELPPLTEDIAPRLKWTDAVVIASLPPVSIVAGLFPSIIGDPIPLPAERKLLAWFLASAAVSIVITIVLSARYAFAPASRAVWIIMSAIFGIYGLLAMLFVRSWPARVPCPGCGERRLVTRESCERCRAPFAPPAMEGIGIFEDDHP